MLLEILLIFVFLSFCQLMIRYRWKKKPEDSLSQATIRQHYLQERKKKEIYMKNQRKSSRFKNDTHSNASAISSSINEDDVQPNTSATLSLISENNHQPSTLAISNLINEDDNFENDNPSNALETSNTNINVFHNHLNSNITSSSFTQSYSEGIDAQSDNDSNDTDEHYTDEYYTDEESSSSNSDGSDNREAFAESPLDQFKSKLASTFISANVSHSQGDKILAILRTHPCFATLPQITKTLLKTPRKPLETIQMGSGEYHHIGLEEEIIKKLSIIPPSSSIDSLIIDIHTDGMSPHRSSHTQIWPIQFRIINIADDKPGIIGVYLGNKKPNNSEEFFKYFIDEYRTICSSHGIHYNEKLIPIHIRGFIADAPARALILNHRGHNSSRACSKCKVVGQSINRTMCFLQISNEARTNEEYINSTDRYHHLPNNESALKYIGFNLVTDVPFEYMHLICLGVVKKFLSAIIDNKYFFQSLARSHIKTISTRLLTMQSYCPYEFSRRPRSIEDYQYYKATEFRQLLLYTGPVVLHNILTGDAYDHFLLLHTACRALLVSCPSEANLEYAQIALKVYVECCAEIYGSTFLSYNIHGLLHVVDDVRKFGNLNTYSAFPYEDNMTFFRKFLRKPKHLLQQLRNRLAEQQLLQKKMIKESQIKPLHKHKDGPVPQNCEHLNIVQYKGLHFEYFRLMANNDRDDCILLNSGQMCKVLNIMKNIDNNNYILAVKKFNFIDNYYKIPYGIDSYYVGVYVCSELSTSIECVYLDELFAKCFKMPYWDGERMDSSKYIAITLLSNY